MRSRLINSFTPSEHDDYRAVKTLIYNKGTFLGDVAVVTDDPYLSLLIFTALSGIYDMNIHILNREEGLDEVQRLLYIAKPDTIICTNDEDYLRLNGAAKVLINADTIVNTKIPADLNDEEYDLYRVITYSPTPTKIQTISGSMIEAMVDSLVEDFEIKGIHKKDERGIIPIATNNIDYLLYFIALKILHPKSAIPTEEEIGCVLNGSDNYKKHNNHSTLFIPKREFVELWDEKITPLFETKLVFKLYLKFAWIINLYIGYKMKQIFKGFKNVIVIGRLENSYMINIIKSISNINVYAIHSIESIMHFGIMSPVDRLVAENTPLRQLIISSKGVIQTSYNPKLTSISYKLSPKNKPMTLYPVTDPQALYLAVDTLNKDGTNIRNYQYVGNINNVLTPNGHVIFPERLEKVINSYPFVRYCALTSYQNKLILIVVPHSNITDSNRINYGMFKRILKRNLEELHKMLPEETNVGSIIISNTVVEKDRNGNISRYALQYINRK